MLRFIESKPVVTGFVQPVSELQRGDAVLELDGTPVANLIERWKPYYADSNDAAMYRDMAGQFTRGPCGPATLKIRRGAEDIIVNTERSLPSTEAQVPRWHDLPGEAFRKLSGDVGYLKISALKRADVERYIDEAAGTKGLIIDIRNYPSDMTLFDLGQRLVAKETPFVHVTTGDLDNPGAFYDHGGWRAVLQPKAPHYTGKVVILVDEVTLSSAEYHAMAFRTAPGAKVVGSTTAGADGNVSQFSLPGGLRTMISGIGILYPDDSPTQRVGIVPDVERRPTIAGIRAGRDEVLEEAIRQVVGREPTTEELAEIAKN